MYLVQTVSSSMRPTRAMPCDDNGGHLGPSQPSPALPSPAARQQHFTPANIRSYLDNTEPIYQNEKFYELITPQKFVKPSMHNTSIKSSDSFNKIPLPSSHNTSIKSSDSFNKIPLPSSHNTSIKSSDSFNKNPHPSSKSSDSFNKNPHPSSKSSDSFNKQVPSSPDVKPNTVDVKEEKKKKWSLGGLFRRRRKKPSDTDSSSADEDSKLGFLARRRSRRDKRKQRGNKTEDKTTTNLLRVEQATSQDSLPGSRDRVAGRHVDSSGGSGSVDGSSRRERRLAAMQRSAVAHTNPSSSEDDSCKTSSLHRSGSLNRRSRYARTERYIKRLSRDEESVLQREAAALQHDQSDACYNTPMSQHDQSDACYITSATPSPAQSPLVRHKNALRVSSSVPHATASNPASLERRTRHRAGHSPLPPSCDPRRQPNHESFRAPGQRSLSYDNNIHRVPTSPQDTVMCVQFPVARISQLVAARPNVRPGPPPPPPRDPQRKVTPLNPSRPMSYAFEDGAAPVRRTQNGSYLSLDNQAISYHHHNNLITDRCNSENPIASAFVRPASTTLVETSANRRSTPQFQYYADQSPRSRKPIHIQHVGQVSAFWKQREMDNAATRLDVPQSPGSSVDNVSPNVDELETQEQWSQLTPKMKYLLDCLPSDNSPTTKSGALNDGIFKARPVVSDVNTNKARPVVKTSQESCPKVVPKARSAFANPKPRFTFHEPAITAKDFGQPLTTKTIKSSVPPAPPVRRYSRQLSSSSLEADEETQTLFICTSTNLQDGKQTPVRTPTNLERGKQSPQYTPTNLESYKQVASTSLETGKQTPVRTAANLESYKQVASTSLETGKQTPVRTAANLEDALDELEAMYKSLQLGDDDLLDRAERRDLPTKFQLREPVPASLAGSLSDSGYEFTPSRRRAPSSRRSGIPDRVADDMAYRRLHPKDRPDSQNIVSQAGSFLLTSPMIQGHVEEHLKTSEPDVTYDDVVYRNIRHVNNSLKVVEPQLPFGIPVGPIAPAANSDYLHATPTERYRPTFKPRRTPDVVGDDLAYRALRKEGATRDGHMFESKKKEGAMRDGQMFESKKKEGATRDGHMFESKKKEGATSDGHMFESKKKEGATRDGHMFESKKKEGAVRDGHMFESKKKEGSTRDGTRLGNDKKKEGSTRDGTRLDNDKRKAGTTRDVSSAVDTALHNARLKDTNFSLRKRRAVRSLSANLPSLICCDQTKMAADVNVTSEKAQSLTHLPDALEIAQKILEGKEVIGGGSNNAMWNVTALRAGDRNSTTSTETLTDSRANLATLLQDKRGSWQQRVRVNGAPPLAGMVDTNRDANREIRDRCLDRKEVDKTGTNPDIRDTNRDLKDTNREIRDGGKDATGEQNRLNADSPLNGTQIEDLLSALARDARSTSEQLGLQLAGFNASEQFRDFNASEQLAGFNTSEQLAGFNASEELTGFNTSKELTGFNTSKELTGFNISEQLDLQLSDLQSEQLTCDKMSDENILSNLRSEQVCSNTNEQLKDLNTSEQVTCDKNNISDDSLDVKAEVLDLESADSDEPITALEDLHIYEPCDVATSEAVTSEVELDAELDADLEALTGEDEEVQAIFRHEDSSNNNSVAVSSPRGKEGATSAVMSGEASLVLLASTYCTQHALAHDWLTVIAICIAVVALLAFLML